METLEKKKEPGVYKNMPDSEYFAIDAVSNSYLKHVKKSPGHAKFAPPDTPTDSKSVGSIAHLALLQPERLETCVKVVPEGNKNSKAFYEQLDSMFPGIGIDKSLNWIGNQQLIAEKCQDVVLTEPGHLAMAKGMATSVVRNFNCKKLLETGESEVVIVWEDEQTGLLCKCKFDKLNTQLGIGVDLKFVEDASPEKFGYAAYDYGWHRQQVHYYDGAKSAGIDLQTNVIIAVEKTPPYPATIYELGDQEWEIANEEIRHLLAVESGCQRTNKYPFYTNSKGQNILTLKLPYKAYKQEFINAFEE